MGHEYISLNDLEKHTDSTVHTIVQLRQITETEQGNLLCIVEGERKSATLTIFADDRETYAESALEPGHIYAIEDTYVTTYNNEPALTSNYADSDLYRIRDYDTADQIHELLQRAQTVETIRQLDSVTVTPVTQQQKTLTHNSTEATPQTNSPETTIDRVTQPLTETQFGELVQRDEAEISFPATAVVDMVSFDTETSLVTELGEIQATGVAGVIISPRPSAQTVVLLRSSLTEPGESELIQTIIDSLARLDLTYLIADSMTEFKYLLTRAQAVDSAVSTDLYEQAEATVTAHTLTAADVAVSADAIEPVYTDIYTWQPALAAWRSQIDTTVRPQSVIGYRVDLPYLLKQYANYKTGTDANQTACRVLKRIIRDIMTATTEARWRQLLSSK